MSCVCVCKPLAKDRRRLGGSSCVGSKSVPASSPTDMNHRTRGRGACSPAAVPAGPRPRRPWFQFQSVRLCRSLPSFAFHLASPVICRRRASRRERGGSMQSQPGAARATVRACRMCKYKHPTLAHSDGKPRVQLSSHATRAQSGLCRPIWVSMRACQLHIPWAMHTRCTRPAGSSRRASGKPPPVACASVRLRRSLPSFAFHLASPVICRERASRRERDGSMQSQPGAARATVRACSMCKYKHSTLSHSDGKPRVQLSSHATRAQSGLCRPIWVSLRPCQLHLPWAMHTGCTRPAGSSRRASGTSPPVACAHSLPW